MVGKSNAFRFLQIRAVLLTDVLLGLLGDVFDFAFLGLDLRIAGNENIENHLFPGERRYEKKGHFNFDLLLSWCVPKSNPKRIVLIGNHLVEIPGLKFVRF
jgi:hypothetical protein